jgi:hypothetical protein
VRCWICGAEPAHLIDVTTFGDIEPQYIPRWPAPTDHAHAERPPTPGELEQAGHEALLRIRAEGLTA